MRMKSNICEMEFEMEQKMGWLRMYHNALSYANSNGYTL
jgi:hypothetical protein